MPIFDLSDVKTSGKLDRIWSPQQEAVFAVLADTDNLRIDAVAGAGKTTTLIEVCHRLPARCDVAFLAFNKRIADEIKEKTISCTNVKAGTFHSFGLAAWKKIAPKADVSADKTDGIMDELDVPRFQRAFVAQMVGFAKQSGFGIVGETRIDDLQAWYAIADWYDLYEKLGEAPTDREKEDAIALCIRVLLESIELSHSVIDFDDMIYMPLKAQCVEARYDWVLVDEAQDTNTLRRLLAARLLRSNGRLIAVGDPHQAIYGFTGANADAMDLIEEMFGCTRLPLTTTYRCPKAVVARAQEWVSHIHAAETAPIGTVSIITNTAFEKLPASALDRQSVVLCRNTKPLVSTALRLIRAGIPARVEGREIGAALVKLATRWKRVGSLAELSDRLEAHLATETQKFLDKGQRAKVAGLEDRVNSLQAVIDSLDPAASILALRSKIESLFGDSDGGRERVLTLSTIHKAKGREWKRVYWLNPDLHQPSKWAKQDWEKQQEKNLCYVAVTRAKETLVEIHQAAEEKV